MQWASSYFSSIKKIATQHDKWIEKEQAQDKQTINHGQQTMVSSSSLWGNKTQQTCCTP